MMTDIFVEMHKSSTFCAGSGAELILICLNKYKKKVGKFYCH